MASSFHMLHLLAALQSHVAKEVELVFLNEGSSEARPGDPSLSPFPCGLNDMSVKAVRWLNNDIIDTNIQAAAQF